MYDFEILCFLSLQLQKLPKYSIDISLILNDNGIKSISLPIDTTKAEMIRTLDVASHKIKEKVNFQSVFRNFFNFLSITTSVNKNQKKVIMIEYS